MTRVLCDEDSEDIDDFFLCCPYSKSIWNEVWTTEMECNLKRFFKFAGGEDQSYRETKGSKGVVLHLKYLVFPLYESISYMEGNKYWTCMEICAI